ncbi:MAG TPA: methyltransferase domain-containing protein [Rhodospirillales bacterium]|nr:methyltransferase domain-containing protein [Rhodospirillales bacterium]
MTAWNPKRYLGFKTERLRPALDLLAGISLESPQSIFDLGCGPGNVTRLLAERWGLARISGIDSSAEMLATARSNPTGTIEWIKADLAVWNPPPKSDLIFSNAALHWLDRHDELLPRLLGQLKPGGVLAVQMPANFSAPSHTLMAETARSGPWRERLEPFLRTEPVAEPEDYVAILNPLTSGLDIWRTEYQHLLEGENPVLDWLRGTALRPLLNALKESERDEFLGLLSARLRRVYPRRNDGVTVFPFRRLFIIATR